VTGPAFVVPLQVDPSAGPQAVHLLAAAWAEAATRRHGSASIITPSGRFDPATLRARASVKSPSAQGRSHLLGLIPLVARTTAKDMRLPLRALGFAQHAVRTVKAKFFVWQHHQPYAVAGLGVARRWGLPLVLHVDAPVVWESRQWGVRRPLGNSVERFGEAPIIRQADLITCPSLEVAEVLMDRFGVPESRVLVTPGGVDTRLFTPDGACAAVGLEVDYVVGWVGSFRRFHGLEHLVRATADLRRSSLNVGLLLVGDGQERTRIETLLRELEIPAVLTGAVASSEVPSFLRAMDVACVTHPGVGGFHYSPMKLREYMATGVASLVPSVGELRRHFVNEREVCTYDPVEKGALEQVLRRLLVDRTLRERVAAGGLARMQTDGSWDAQLRRVVERLQLR
jgi:glycosyltransferase involved in cell wall biosynthesis